ncbi:MAG TPA: hypothetical protein VKR06_40570 [Ktedonosporobacter sp.]|nr:hypothetical protein [Ktedonosporobacter sp.]
MSKSQNAQSIRPTNPSGNHSLQRGVLLMGTGLLLVWLSVGLPQSTWSVLLRTLVQFGALQGQLGMGLLGPFALLIVQSLLLLVAWGIFLWVAIREVRQLLAPRTAGQPSQGAQQAPKAGQPMASAQPSYVGVQQAKATPIASQPPSGVGSMPGQYATPPAAYQQPAGVPQPQPYTFSFIPPPAPAANIAGQAARGVAHHVQQPLGNPFEQQLDFDQDRRQAFKAPPQFGEPAPSASQPATPGRIPPQIGAFDPDITAREPGLVQAIKARNLPQLSQTQQRTMAPQTPMPNASRPSADQHPSQRGRMTGSKPEIYYQEAVVNNPYEAFNPYEKVEAAESARPPQRTQQGLVAQTHQPKKRPIEVRQVFVEAETPEPQQGTQPHNRQLLNPRHDPQRVARPGRNNNLEQEEENISSPPVIKPGLVMQLVKPGNTSRPTKAFSPPGSPTSHLEERQAPPLDPPTESRRSREAPRHTQPQVPPSIQEPGPRRPQTPPAKVRGPIPVTQVSSVEPADPFLVQEASQPQAPSTPQEQRPARKARSVDHREDFGDPFAVQADPFQMFYTANSIEEATSPAPATPQQARRSVQPEPDEEPVYRERSVPQKAQQPAQPQAPARRERALPQKAQPVQPELEEEADDEAADQSLFLYGNPFDGPLPDVFEHDEELKRAIREQQEPPQQRPPARPAASEEQKPPHKRRRRR